MKDLYRKLELEPSATTEEIATALEKRPDVKASAGILLDPEQRRRYDRTHTTLQMIAALRFRLDLDRSDSWFIRRFPDFAIMPRPKLGESARQAAADQAAQVRQESSGKRRRDRPGWLLPLVILVLVVAAAGLLLLL